jgi:hypothetical protein
MNKLEKAFQLFDSYNRQDPHTLVWEGKEYAAEHFYALQLHTWVRKLDPEASDALLLASRCQHLGRWKSPRQEYPAGKAGYLRWRSDLAKFHASEAKKILEEVGYTEHEIQEVQHIILKQNLKADKDVQTIENALCLVFLEFQLEDFIKKHDDEKLVRIVQKSWKKMSEPGRTAALALTYTPKAKSLLEKALH